MDTCQLCQQTEEWHRTHKPKHQFVGAGEGDAIKVENGGPALEVSRAGDPILRMALIHAGVITEADLAQATDWVNAARENGKALVLLPDEDGKMKFHLADLDEAMRMKAGG